MKKYNPEKRTWRGRSYKAGGRRVRELREREVFEGDTVEKDHATVVEWQTRCA